MKPDMAHNDSVGPLQLRSWSMGDLGLVFRVARSLKEVVAAWHLVYRSYLESQLIGANLHRLHTAPQAIASGTAILLGRIGPLIVTTLTTFTDSESIGLPLDRIYGSQLDALRQRDRRLMEVGLFADRRQGIGRSTSVLMHLMRYAFYYGLRCDVTDFVIGIHPRHATFYIRYFGFEQFGESCRYPAVNNNPVVLLRGDLQANFNQRGLHPAVELFLRTPVSEDAFDNQFRLDQAPLKGTLLEAYLQEIENTDKLGRVG